MFNYPVSQKRLGFSIKNRMIMVNDKIEIPPINYDSWNQHKESQFIKKDDNIYIIHTIGKVASKSIFEVLKNKMNTPIYHLHYLSFELLDKMYKWFVLNTSYKSNHAEIIDGKNFRNIYKKHKQDIKLKIITLIREPISWQISMLTEIALITYPEIVNEDKFNYELFYLMLNKSLKNSKDSPILNLRFYENWWHSEFSNIFNYNILEKDFDPIKGWEIYDYGKISTLIIQYEQLNSVYKEAFSSFGLPNDIVLPHINKLTDKKLGDIDPEILKKNVKLKNKEIKKLFKSSIVTHFYSKEQIIDFFNYWTTDENKRITKLFNILK